MKAIESSDKLKLVHSDIRGPVFEKAMEMTRVTLSPMTRMVSYQRSSVGMVKIRITRIREMSRLAQRVIFAESGTHMVITSFWRYHSIEIIESQ